MSFTTDLLNSIEIANKNGYMVGLIHIHKSRLTSADLEELDSVGLKAKIKGSRYIIRRK